MGARSALPLSSWRRSFRMARSTGSSSFSFIRADCHRRYARQSLKGPKISGSKRCIGCKRDAWSQRIAAQARLVSLRCEANREKRSSPMAHVVSLLNDDHQEEGKLLDGQSRTCSQFEVMCLLFGTMFPASARASLLWQSRQSKTATDTVQAGDQREWTTRSS